MVAVAWFMMMMMWRWVRRWRGIVVSRIVAVVSRIGAVARVIVVRGIGVGGVWNLNSLCGGC
jgi:hypothetical protein